MRREEVLPEAQVPGAGLDQVVVEEELPYHPDQTRQTEEPPLIEDSDSDFLPVAEPSKVTKKKIHLYNYLPEIMVPFVSMTDSAKCSFAVKVMRAIMAPGHKLGEKVKQILELWLP